MLQNIEGIDICLSAHTHNRLYKSVSVNNSIIIQCGCHGSFLAHLRVIVEDKRITGHQYSLLKVAENIYPDKEMDKILGEILHPY